MPKLLVFLTAERVIVAQDQTASAITIFHGINVGLEALPDKLIASTRFALPINWVAFAAWLREAEDEGKSFQQRLSIKLPNGSIAEVGILRFSPAARVHRTLYNVPFFPFVGPGEYKVSVALREDGTGHRWKKAGAYPIDVRIVTQVGENQTP